MQMKDVLNFIIPDEFGIDYEDSGTSASIEIVLDQINNPEKDIRTVWGVSQFVILSKNWDKVIKIPFNGWFKWDYNYDIPYFEEFYCCKDYSTRGYQIYEDAVDEGLEKIFAKIEFFGCTKDGRPVYTQEKIDSLEIDGKKYKDFSKESLKTAVKIKTSKYCKFSAEWLSAAIDWYGENYILNVIDFIERHNLKDFHSENYGYREDGSPCIVDFSDFLE